MVEKAISAFRFQKACAAVEGSGGGGGGRISRAFIYACQGEE